jgi:hypothetical protein
MSVPSIPTNYDIDLSLDGGMDLTLDGGLDGTATIVGDPSRPLSTLIIGDPAKPVAALVIGDPLRPIATDSKMELLNLPRFTLKDIDHLRSTRVRLPNYSSIGFRFFGQEFFSICMNGEAQVITEPYVPNAMEQCESPCCEPDTRPFPEKGGQTDVITVAVAK